MAPLNALVRRGASRAAQAMTLTFASLTAGVLLDISARPFRLGGMSAASVPADIRETLATWFRAYGPQGWWPLLGEKHAPLQGGVRHLAGYHPGQFGLPRTRRGRWEVASGAVLTQNTTFSNASLALQGLQAARLTTPERVRDTPAERLQEIIRPAGYFRQKARYLQSVAEWFIGSDRAAARSPASSLTVTLLRPRLLEVLGVGLETADSILLYAYHQPVFVIDAYTRRVFGALGAIEPGASYESLRLCFEVALDEGDPARRVCAWQEAHALIVEHAKRQRRPTPRP